MALTKVNRGGLNTGISDSSNATFLSVDASEVATLLTSAVINSEGGAVTTNIAQGLIKCFMDLNGTGTIALRDSFNISSVADNGTGLYTVTIANDFSSINYGYAGTAESSTDGQNGRIVTSVSTQSLAGSTKLRGQQLDFTGQDLPHIRVGWWGDLA